MDDRIDEKLALPQWVGAAQVEIVPVSPRGGGHSVSAVRVYNHSDETLLIRATFGSGRCLVHDRFQTLAPRAGRRCVHPDPEPPCGYGPPSSLWIMSKERLATREVPIAWDAEAGRYLPQWEGRPLDRADGVELLQE